jgi:hypothetical protein
MPQPTISVLHIGKTGGSALKDGLSSYMRRTEDKRFALHSHKDTLETIWAVDPRRPVFFTVRDPITRFVSGFNSRLRHGRPRYDVAWTDSEAVAFSRFTSPNALGEALSDRERRDVAVAAMSQIQHVNTALIDWLVSPTYLQEHADKAVYIGHQSDLTADEAQICEALGVPAPLLPKDDIGAHRTPAEMPTRLSDLATANLAHWYALDFAVYDWCLEHRRARGWGRPSLAESERG